MSDSGLQRTPSVPPPTDPDGSFHQHSDDIEKSRDRSQTSTERPGSGTLRPVGSRSGRTSSATERRPGSGSRPSSSTSRPGSGSGRNIAASPSEEITPLDKVKKEPLPPIGAKDDPDSTSPPPEEFNLVRVESSTIASTMAGGTQAPRNKGRFPRVVSYRPEIDIEEGPDPSAKTTSTVATPEEKVVIGKDGTEMVVKSIDCQTEWSWMKDMEMVQSMSSTPGDKFSRQSTIRAPTQTPGDVNEQEEDVETELNSRPSDLPIPGVSRTSERRASRASVHSASSRTSKSQKPKQEKSGPTKAAVTPGVPPGYQDDTYGIPILELSSDTDYQRESAAKLASGEEEKGTPVSTDTLFEGKCEFCGASIKPFPSLEDQKVMAPEELYCCDEYRAFLEVMYTSNQPPQDAKLIDVSPHAPHGSKQARRAAKERAAQSPVPRTQKPPENIDGDLDSANPSDSESDTSESDARDNKPLAPGIESKLKKPTLEPKVPIPPETDLSTGEPQDIEFDDFLFDDSIARIAAENRARIATQMRERELQKQQAVMSGGGGFGGGGGGASNFYHLAQKMKTINYQLSSQKCLEEGWTLRPPSPLLDQEPEVEVFEPQPALPAWADDAGRDSKEAGLVLKYYPDKSPFVILFPDGTGNAFYPSGRVAISISCVDQGLYTYLAHADSDENPDVLAVFDPDGHATSYYNHGGVRVCLDPFGGMELDTRGCKKRKWSWKEQVEHIHAPPIQPITFAVTSHLSIRIMSQENITLTFTHSAKSCRFQVGTRLKLVSKENMPPSELDEDMLFREEVKSRIDTLFSKVSNLLKFPKCPKLDRLPGPAHITSREEKMQKLRQSFGRSAKGDKDKKNAPAVIRVN